MLISAGAWRASRATSQQARAFQGVRVVSGNSVSAFLWDYLHSSEVPLSPQAFSRWRDSPDTHEKCTRLAGIATVAHMYEAHDVAVWAIELALKMLEVNNRSFVPEPAMLGDLYSVALKVWMAASASPDQPNVVLYWQRVEAVWMDVLSFVHIDAVPYLLEAQKVNSSPLQAVGYFYTLRRGAGAISEDARLTAMDRRRLLTGMFSFVTRGQPLAENSWTTPSPPAVVNGQWQPRRDTRLGDINKLWDTFATAPWNIES